MKTFRKLISFLLVLSCLQFMFIPSSAVVVSTTSLPTVDVSYEEFSNADAS